MNTHDPDIEPLDDDEREFARVVRALPAGEPPAALDARILKAASDAVASRPRRRLAWLASGGTAAWGIGSAAAAVLAIGVAWHTMNPTPYSLPPSAPVTVQDMEEQESLPVEFRERSDADLAAMAPPPPPADLPQAQMHAPVPPPAMAPPPPPPAPAAPMPFPETGLDEHVAHAPAAAANVEPVGSGSINAIDVSSAESTTVLSAEQVAKLDVPARQRAELARDAAAAKASQPAPASSAAFGAAGRSDAYKEDARQRVQADTKRYPESWLLKIRTRVKEGDMAGARASLALFVAKYPKHPVPDDLKPLLKR